MLISQLITGGNLKNVAMNILVKAMYLVYDVIIFDVKYYTKTFPILLQCSVFWYTCFYNIKHYHYRLNAYF